VSEPGRDPKADRSPPAAPGGAVRIFNRSDRVWIYGYVRLAPLVVFFVGMATLCVVSTQIKDLPTTVVLPLTIIIFVGPFVLDRLPQLNPVNFLILSKQLRVTRIAGRPWDFAPARIVSVELTPREGEEYDDGDRGRRLVNVVVRFRGRWPARLVATDEAATALANWARRRGRPVHEPPPGGHEPG